MKEYFLSDTHYQRFLIMGEEMELEHVNNSYWRSLLYIFSGDEQLFENRNSLVDFRNRVIHAENWFTGEYSGGEQRLLALAFNLFTDIDYFEFDNGDRYYISPLYVFSGLDEKNYLLAKNAIDVRLESTNTLLKNHNIN